MQHAALMNKLGFCPGTLGGGRGPSTASEDNVVWRGNLRIQWDANEVVVPVMACSMHVPAFPKLCDTAAWPADIICDTAQLTEVHHYFALMTDARAQWMARFVASDNDGAKAALQRLAATMARRAHAFEIECGAMATGVLSAGTLYLWSTEPLGMVAVYRPAPPPNPHAYDFYGMGVGGVGGGGVAPFGIPRPQGAGIWTGFLQMRLRERAENLYVSACQSNVSRDFGVLDTSTWPFNLWCAPSNMLVASPLLESMHENSNQWIVRFAAATPSDSHTQNALRSLAVYMQARRLMFEVSCGTLNGDELMLCLFGVVHASYGNSIVGGFRVAADRDDLVSGKSSRVSKSQSQDR